MKILIDALLKLIEIARVLGLNEYDLKNAQDFATHNEFGLCFDTILTQMYEYDIEIDKDIYELIIKIGKSMNLNEESYSFMKDLIRDDINIPRQLRTELVKIIVSFT